MATPDYLQPGYFGAMDRPSYLAPKDTGYYAMLDNSGDITVPGNTSREDLGLEIQHIGATLNPSQNQVQALQAKIREGASKVEFEFLGRAKGNAQQPTPEMHSKEMRDAIRQLLALNKVKGSTHATFTVSGLAGFTNQGFSKQQQNSVIQEVQRAISFAKDATTGGAIIMHTGEWMRPVHHAAQEYGDAEAGYKFKSYDDEDKEGISLMVDGDTGAFIRESTQINQGTVVEEPQFMTAKEYEEKFGKTGVVGKPQSVKNEDTGKVHEVTIQEDDWVDMNGDIINPTDPRSLFKRIPLFNKENVEFLSRPVKYDEMRDRADMYNERFGMDVKPEVLFAQTQMDTQIMQLKGSSIYHGQGYNDLFEQFIEQGERLDEMKNNADAAKQLFEQQIDGHLTAITGYSARAQQIQEQMAYLQQQLETNEDERAKNQIQAQLQELSVQFAESNAQRQQYIATAIRDPHEKQFMNDLLRTQMTPEELEDKKDAYVQQRYDDQIRDIEQGRKQIELRMRHTHESSGSADARAEELIRRRGKITDIENYGLKQSGQALGKLAMEAMVANKQAIEMRKNNKAELDQWEDMYIAPENIFANEYGSHPTELLRIVEAGREDFKERLKHQGITDAKEQDRLAKKHIKTTFDIGHLNMWRNLLERNPGESEEHFQGRFNEWMLMHLEKLHEADAIGHLHITDNFGINDSHLTAGEGNAPIKEFVKFMTDRGYKDFIVEAGGYNVGTYMHDSWAYLGAAPSKGAYKPFGSQWKQHSGMYGAARYHHRAYVPSNEWTLWSGVPLE